MSVEETVLAKAENFGEAAVAAVEAVAQKLEGKVEEKVAEVEKAAVVQITAEEKLAAREIELEFLKLQMELQRLNKAAEAQQAAYKSHIESLTVKYALSKTEYVFDGVINAFKKL